jgi:hypothetical protein
VNSDTMRRPFRRAPASRRDPLLADVVGSIYAAPVREELIREDPKLHVFGDHDPGDGTIRLNVPLLRVLVFLHEATHRVRPRWDERTVRSQSRRLLHALDADDVDALNAQLVDAIAAERPRS